MTAIIAANAQLRAAVRDLWHHVLEVLLRPLVNALTQILEGGHE